MLEATRRAWRAILDVVTFLDSGREPLPLEGVCWCRAVRNCELPEAVYSRQLALLTKSGLSAAEIEEGERASIALIEHAVAGSTTRDGAADR